MSLILVTGGVRSGKSRFAEELAGGYGRDVLYVATGQVWDEEMRKRIELHRQRRPAGWGLREIGGKLSDSLSDADADAYPVVLIDCLSTWISGRLMDVPEPSWRDETITGEILAEAERWLDKAAATDRIVIAVTSEVGLGGVALSKLGRWFADVLGDVNQRTARRADAVYAVMAGIPWRLKG
ncbi:bifunctional adenosylcobinamide kinase/adenosylcobinamide-phosphate guanylyltransferase [Brevibacillus composti]|uniref:Adenosylcobinamide kinase n=1 Tax=Brevibacillus composti TaxID=2796470 RepID=A0A7T5EJ94_9BACL|nr:bifunctional adenosylcobinamide kinase/adenosylcobinamide-phosphate guanylyltransferase [Brevibacillus composti]QQE73641.1 bifunctional adenosylcobinamide kinase/adenosylcobinamide-phosphate guanylyltransferase [Brevibacillus composti]QUO40723.1 bifunctional adenosylcobinamide kinase/adenosylcobinamide-phosphate guanylyltransferase [Brevibacillus composti]